MTAMFKANPTPFIESSNKSPRFLSLDLRLPTFLFRITSTALFVSFGALHSYGTNSITIQSPTGGSHITASNDNLTVNVNYASSGGGYQTPTWAYRIDSGFPGYGSPHGGTQVTGTTTWNDFLLSPDQAQEADPTNVASNPGQIFTAGVTGQLGKIKLAIHPSGAAGATLNIRAFSSNVYANMFDGSILATSEQATEIGSDYKDFSTFNFTNGPTLTVGQKYVIQVLNANVYEKINGAYAGGHSDSGTNTAYGADSNGVGPKDLKFKTFMVKPHGTYQINVALLDQLGNLHNPPAIDSIQVNYQSGGGNYQSGGGNYQSGGGNYQQIGSFNFFVRGYVDLNNSDAPMAMSGITAMPVGGIKAWASNHQWIYFQVYMNEHHTSSDSSGKKIGNAIWALSIENAAGGQPNMIVDMSGKVYHGDFSTYWFRAHGIETWNDSHWHESRYATTATAIDSLMMAHPVINDPHALVHTIKPFDFIPDGQANLSSQAALLKLSGNYAKIYFQKYHFPETTVSTGTHDGFLSPLDIVAGQQRYQSSGGNYQSGGGNYQSGGGGFFPYTGPYTSPTQDLRIDTRNALFDDHIENKNLNSVAKLKADYNTTQAFNDNINALVGTLPTLPAPPSTSRGDAIDNWIKVEFETVKVLDPKKEAAFVWVLSLEEANDNASNKVIDMHGNIYEADFESYWLSVYGVPTHKDPNWSEIEYNATTAGIAKLYQDHPFIDPGIIMESMHKLAVLETDTPHVQGNVIHMSGTLRESNGTAIMQAGFLVSSQGHPAMNDPKTQVVPATTQNNLMSATYSVSNAGTYYVRSFAETKGGLSEGPVRKIEIFLDNMTSGDAQSIALSIIREGTIELSGGWRQSSWFGLYLDHGNGWIYHQVHGWLYMVHDGKTGIWTWHQQRGWLWTNNSLYPYLYQNSTASWLYLLGIANGRAVFFNYGTYLVEF